MRRQLLQEGCGVAAQVVEDDLEARAIEAGDPAAEVATAGTVGKKRRCEADPNAGAGRRRPHWRAPFRPHRVDRTSHDGREPGLQETVVFPLIREQEVRPAKVIAHVGERPAADERRHLLLQARKPVAIALARRRDGRWVGVDHRQRERLAKRGAQKIRLSRTRVRVNAQRGVEIVALGQCPRELQHRVRVVGSRRDDAVEEVDGIVDVATLARDAGERLDEAQIGLERQCAPERVARGAIVAKIEQQRSEIPPGERVVGLHRDCPADGVHSLGEPAAGAQRTAQVVPCARIAGVEADGDRQRIDGPAHIAHVGKENAERIAKAGIAGVAGDRVLDVRDRAGDVSRHFPRLRAQRQRGTNVLGHRARRREDGRQCRQRFGRPTRAEQRLGVSDPCISHRRTRLRRPAPRALAPPARRGRRARARGCARRYR